MSSSSLFLSLLGAFCLHFLGFFLLSSLDGKGEPSFSQTPSRITFKVRDKKKSPTRNKETLERLQETRREPKALLQRVEVATTPKEVQSAPKPQILGAKEDVGGGSSHSVASGFSLEKEGELLSFESPEYTEEALEAELEGLFEISVFVSEEGKALEVNLLSSVGYGMDELLIEASLKASFLPKRNRQGKAVKSWVSFQIQLEMW